MIAVTIALVAAALQAPETGTVVVRWQELPVAKALQQEMRAHGASCPALDIVNAYAWTRQRGLGFLCPAGDTPPGFADVPSGSIRSMSYCGFGMPMLPGFGSIHGNVPRVMQVSVWPKPSMRLIPVSSRNFSYTAPLSASPAVQQYLSDERSYFEKSS